MIVRGKYTTANIMIEQVDMNCMEQIVKMVNHEAFTNPISIMPDCHSGKGSVIGFTMPMGLKIIPNVIGVDIGCGVLSFNIGNIKINHQDFDDKVRRMIPFGTNINKRFFINLDKETRQICDRVGVSYDYAFSSLGTLGSGNHFIEVGKSVNTSDIWITIHSGSRYLGKKICEYWQDIASKKEYKDFTEVINYIKTIYPKNDWNTRIKEYKEKMNKVKNSELDFLENKEDIDGYLSDMYFAQYYASMNRHIIMNSILFILGVSKTKNIIETVHNYIDPQDGIIRKGAIRSYIGEAMIIPFNMRDGVLICEGKSNPDWNFSAPHGAGRIYSRSKAKEELNLEKFERDMSDIFSTSVCRSTLDESPDAYKDSSVIEKAIEPTAKILDRITPIHNMKDISTEKHWMKKK